jgi:NAD(P)-dependent dehydrogenase (short-subunit alcohol dehydrogenase family)
VNTSTEQTRTASYPEKLEKQQQEPPGHERAMRPKADHGEESYRGSGKLKDRVALITGADSGIGKAVAIAFAREGADVSISYLNEHDDAEDTANWVSKANRRPLLCPGDITDEAHCKDIIHKTTSALGRLDILVCNAAFQMNRESLDEISSEEWDKTFRTNIYSMFYLVKAAVPQMRPGSAIITTSSVNLDSPRPTLLPYAATKAAIQNFTGNLAQILADKGIRANSVAPGPIWTPLIPSTMPPEQVEKFGQSVPMHRPGQPAELAPVYVLLASPEASYVSGATVAVTGGKPVI